MPTSAAQLARGNSIFLARGGPREPLCVGARLRRKNTPSHMAPSPPLPPSQVRFLRISSLLGAGVDQITRSEAELMFIKHCGKGGSMDVYDFAEILAGIGARLRPGKSDGGALEMVLDRLQAGAVASYCISERYV